MRKSALMEKVPGLTGPVLDYLARSGYVKFTPIPEGEITHRDFPDSEVPYLKYFASLLKDGVSPKKACKKAREKYPV